MVESESISKCDSDSEGLEPPDKAEKQDILENESDEETNKTVDEKDIVERADTLDNRAKDKEGKLLLANARTASLCFPWWSEGYTAFSLAASASVFLGCYSISIPLSTKGLDRIDMEVYPIFVFSILVSIVIYLLIVLVIKFGTVLSLLSEEACELYWTTRKPLTVIGAGISSCIALGLKVGFPSISSLISIHPPPFFSLTYPLSTATVIALLATVIALLATVIALPATVITLPATVCTSNNCDYTT